MFDLSVIAGHRSAMYPAASSTRAGAAILAREGAMHGRKNGRFWLAERPADYNRLGIAPVEIAKFEDGQRISTESGHYEWWYFDAHLDDGATVVVVFYTKPNVSPGGPLAPRVTINITLPDGRTFDKLLDTAPETFSASKSTCDVRIGTNHFVGDLNRYHIAATIEEISVDIELSGQVRAWRPKSGHLYFGTERHAKLFAWLPAVPNGLASVRYRIGDREIACVRRVCEAPGNRSGGG
jgi:hypothetical protein